MGAILRRGAALPGFVQILYSLTSDARLSLRLLTYFSDG